MRRFLHGLVQGKKFSLTSNYKADEVYVEMDIL